MEKENIYTKLQQIQNRLKELVKTEENKFQKYYFFNELQIMRIIKPLLEKYKLIILISDDTSQPFVHELSPNGKEHYVKYLKKLRIIDAEDPNETNQLSFNFWACGSNSDLSKAKGSGDTYSIKYMLSKLFLIPAKDDTDPDISSSEISENDKKKINKLFLNRMNK